MAKNKAKMNKFVTSAITATMVASAVAPVAALAADESTSKFTDISGYAQDTQDKINALVEAGIVNGTSDTTFSPSTAIKRSQVVKLLGRYLVESGIAEVPANWDTKERFKDVPVDFQDADLVKNAAVVYDAGVFQGNNGVLNGAGEISRQNMALVLDRAAEAITGKSFVDLAAGKDYNVADITDAKPEAQDAIKALNALEISTVENFKPAYNVSRANFATFLFNAIEVIKDVEVEEEVAKVESVTATNGTLTVVFDKTPDAVPAVTDFKVTENVNGKTKAINASSVQWDAATKTAKLAVPTIYATEVDQNVSYSVGYKETAAKSSASFQVAKVTEAKVDSVTALNSKQIQLVFNQEMDKASVEDVTKYLFAAEPQGKAIENYTTQLTKAAGSTAKLQGDKKTVIITLGNNEQALAGVFKANGILENKTSIGVALAAQSVKAVSGKVLEKDAMFAIKLDDTTAPTVSKVEVNELGGLDVTFNEQVDSTEGKITVNGFTYDVSGAEVNVSHANGVSTATIEKTALTDSNKANLELGKSYTIAVSEQKDVYGKVATSVFSSSFTYAVNAVAPVLKSVVAEGEKSFILEFNKPVTQVDPAGALTVQVNKGAKQLVTTITKDLGNGKYLVELAGADTDLDVLYDRAKNETSTNLTVYIPAIKDAAGNITAAGNTSVTLSKDVTKPAVEKAVSTGAQLDVTLTEKVNQIADLAPGAYVLAENGRQIPVKTADFIGDLITADAKEFSFVYESDNTKPEYLAEGNYTLVIKKDTLTDLSLNNGNKNDEIRIPFAVGAGLQVKPEVSGPVVADGTPGELVVNFTSPVTYQSVANYKNYKIDGIEIPSASTFTLDSTGTKLTIKLPEATYKQTKDRVVSITGARNLAGTVMQEYQKVTKVSENEEIKLQSAKVVGDDVILTFNENVDAATLTGGATPFVIGDFIVKANGVSIAESDLQVEDSVDVNDETKVAKNQLKISSPDQTKANFATGTITVEVKEGAAAKDVAGNKATPVIVTVSR